MFGKRPTFGAGATGSLATTTVAPAAPPPVVARAIEAAPALASTPLAASKPVVNAQVNRKSEEYYLTKATVFGALIEAIDLSQIGRAHV